MKKNIDMHYASTAGGGAMGLVHLIRKNAAAAPVASSSKPQRYSAMAQNNIEGGATPHRPLTDAVIPSSDRESATA